MRLNILLIIVLLFTACSELNKSVLKTKMDYNLPAEAYKPRLTASDPARWKPVTVRINVPEEGVELSDSGLFKLALERNIHYLLNSFSVNHMLVPFRIRAGKQYLPDDRPQVSGWETDLRGSCAGRFMMGAGNSLRWMEDKELRNRLNELIDGIEDCREPDGYILAYPHSIDSLRHEEANYARAWLTHGLIDAALAGNSKAYGLLRGHADRFNQWNELHPKLLYWSHNSHQGHIASTRTYLSPVGKPEDLHIAEKYYVCDWWMDELAARRDSAVWQYPLQNPHSYLITSFEAYFDHYLATGDKTYLNAALGAWELIHDKWEHVGGSIAICENQWFVEDGKRILKDWGDAHERSHPPYSYYLGGYGHSGETCGSAFWIKLNQRLHRLFPNEEKYTAEIEKSIYNVILACQTEKGFIRYHADMEGVKDYPEEAVNSCCEGQGTRILGSLPEYIYSIASDGIYVNLYEASAIRWNINNQTVALKQQTRFPFGSDVSLKISTSSQTKMNVYLRMPSWAVRPVDIAVNGKKVTTGKPGTYVTLARKWSDGDEIAFSLPMELKTTKYTGIDSFPALKWSDDYQFISVNQKESKIIKQADPSSNRYAVEYGPLLLAAVYKDKEVAQVLNIDTLIPDISRPLYFSLENDSTHYFMPYWLLSKETFAVYPFGSTTGKAKVAKHER